MEYGPTITIALGKVDGMTNPNLYGSANNFKPLNYGDNRCQGHILLFNSRIQNNVRLEQLSLHIMVNYIKRLIFYDCF